MGYKSLIRDSYKKLLIKNKDLQFPKKDFLYQEEIEEEEEEEEKEEEEEEEGEEVGVGVGVDVGVCSERQFFLRFWLWLRFLVILDVRFGFSMSSFTI